MSTTPARAEVIGPVADNRVGNGIDNQCRGNGNAHQPRIQAHHLAVKQQQKIIKTIIFYTESRCPEPIR